MFLLCFYAVRRHIDLNNRLSHQRNRDREISSKYLHITESHAVATTTKRAQKEFSGVS